MNRQALVSVGLLVTGIAAAMAGCGDDDSAGDPGNKAGESSSAGHDSAGQSAGGSGSVVTPKGGEGGVSSENHAGQGGSAVIEGGSHAGGVGGDTGGAPAAGADGQGGTFDGCGLEASYGDLGVPDGKVTVATVGTLWRGELPAPPPYSGVISIELYPDIAPFTNGIVPVTNHVLAGIDLNYETCGLCVRLIAEHTVGAATLRDVYFVTGGKVTLSSVEGSFTGVATNLTFEEVTVDESTYHSTPVEDGCQSSIEMIGFDSPLPQGGAGGAGG